MSPAETAVRYAKTKRRHLFQAVEALIQAVGKFM